MNFPLRNIILINLVLYVHWEFKSVVYTLKCKVEHIIREMKHRQNDGDYTGENQDDMTYLCTLYLR